MTTTIASKNKTDSAQVHLLGIRHHGPGSARSLEASLQEIKPDIVLIEGPPEAEALIKYVQPSSKEEQADGEEAGGPGLIPPVALLIYAKEMPKLACYYPFAEFSPEWRAMLYANQSHIPCRFIDLPQSHWLSMQSKQKQSANIDQVLSNLTEADKIRLDPIGTLASLAGYEEGEVWWEQLVEQRSDSQIFEAVSEAMTALRTAVREDEEEERSKIDEDKQLFDEDYYIEPLREAHMRTCIRQAQKEGYKSIAVVCGAWHGPALAQAVKAKDDNQLLKENLKDLPKLKVEATWIPWTNSRLSFESGYGAGITSPGWYEHLFHSDKGSDTTLSWLVKAVKLLRAEDFDASSAQVIDAVRLVESLASMRNLHHAGLAELQQALVTCVLSGNEMPLALIEKKLLVGEKLGHVPAEVPGTPLMVDLQKTSTRLKLKQEALEKLLELDLRKPLDLERSSFLSCLQILGIAWGEKQKKKIKTSTFHETWKLQWQPSLSLAAVEASIWGKDVRQAATTRAIDLGTNSPTFAHLVDVLSLSLDGGLLEAVEKTMTLVGERSATCFDLGELMEALPVLVGIARYGNVRGHNPQSMDTLITSITERIIVNLESSCLSLDEDAARRMQRQVTLMEEALRLFDKKELLEDSRAVLHRLASKSNIPALISGRSAKLLYECSYLSQEETVRLMHFALSAASAHSYSGQWLEGFLTNNAQVLIHDPIFFHIVDDWVKGIKTDAFQELLPLLRKTFGAFSYSERRQISERVQSPGKTALAQTSERADDDRLLTEVLKTVQLMLGVNHDHQ
ncbi:MAG TPA: DUF5682 family protein [Candidatus Obscuribacter sp.]|nr:DUF5682 family protein [Candidatus Obscuribacter sp.]HND69183.1 DUF5682 family protein [Candidatus Obscuribacter sp.]HNG75510.1 DUF5682 family protein [Candidatus Obscuribacter sp.]